MPSGFGGGYVNAGSKTNEQVVVWEKFKKKILLKVKSYNAIANDSLPIYKSVKSNNLEPIIYAFDIKAKSTDSRKCVRQNWMRFGNLHWRIFIDVLEGYCVTCATGLLKDWSITDRSNWG